MRYAVLVLIFAALAVPASAQAAPVLSFDLGKASVRYGASHTITGTLVDGTVPLGAQELVLEGKRYPFEGSYRVIGRTTTDADGKYSFKPELDRNHRLRISAPAQSIQTDVMKVYVLPAFELSFRAIRPGVVRPITRYEPSNG